MTIGKLTLPPPHLRAQQAAALQTITPMETVKQLHTPPSHGNQNGSGYSQH